MILYLKGYKKQFPKSNRSQLCELGKSKIQSKNKTASFAPTSFMSALLLLIHFFFFFYPVKCLLLISACIQFTANYITVAPFLHHETRQHPSSSYLLIDAQSEVLPLPSQPPPLSLVHVPGRTRRKLKLSNRDDLLSACVCEEHARTAAQILCESARIEGSRCRSLVVYLYMLRFHAW